MSTFFIGIVFAIILVKTKFCFFSGFRNFFYFKDYSFISALFLAIFIQSFILFSLESFSLIKIPLYNFSFTATIIGALSFGIGMAFSKSCPSSAFTRSTTLNPTYLLTSISFLISLALFNGVLKKYVDFLLKDKSSLSNIYIYFNISAWYFVFLLGVLTCFLLYKNYKDNNNKLYLAGFLLAFLSILMYKTNNFNSSFSIFAPSKNMILYFFTNQYKYLNSSVYFLYGLFLGSLLANIKNIKLQGVQIKQAYFSVFGGFLMAFGANCAGGCNISNLLISTAYFSIQAWIFLIFMLLAFLPSLAYLTKERR